MASLEAEQDGLLHVAPKPTELEGVAITITDGGGTTHGAHGDGAHDDHGHGHAALTGCGKVVYIIQKYSLPLLVGVVAAMVMANGGHGIEEFYHSMFHTQWGHLAVMGHPITLHFLINDIFMAFFFGIAAKEITEACLPGGSLNPPLKAANPLFATLGGVMGPVGVYLVLGSTLAFGAPTPEDFCKPIMTAAAAAVGGGHRRLESIEVGETGIVECIFGTAWEEIWGADECHDATAYCTEYLHDPEYVMVNYTIQDYAWGTISHGWGIPTATDISLAWMIAGIVFGAGHPAISFLLLLAVADDGLGLIIIAVFYPNPNHEFAGAYLLLVLGGMLLAFSMRKKWVMSWPLYILGPGVMCWFGLVGAALHPALALVPIVPFLPSGKPPAEEDADAKPYEAVILNIAAPPTPTASAGREIDKKQRANAMEIFDRLDVDNCKTLGHDEVERYLVELGETHPDDPTKCSDEALARFQIDIDRYLEQDGSKEQVTFEEFYRWCVPST
jgi:Na+/H+ antiporter NhaA